MKPSQLQLILSIVIMELGLLDRLMTCGCCSYVCLPVCLSVLHIKEAQPAAAEEEQSDTHSPTCRQKGSDGGDKETTNDQELFEL